MVSPTINFRGKVRKLLKSSTSLSYHSSIVVLDSLSVSVSLLEAVYLMTVSALCTLSKTGYRKSTGKIL